MMMVPGNTVTMTQQLDVPARITEGERAYVEEWTDGMLRQEAAAQRVTLGPLVGRWRYETVHTVRGDLDPVTGEMRNPETAAQERWTYQVEATVTGPATPEPQETSA